MGNHQIKGRPSIDGLQGDAPAVKIYLPEDVMDRFYDEARSRGMTLSALGRDILIMRYASPSPPADEKAYDGGYEQTGPPYDYGH